MMHPSGNACAPFVLSLDEDYCLQNSINVLAGRSW